MIEYKISIESEGKLVTRLLREVAIAKSSDEQVTMSTYAAASSALPSASDPGDFAGGGPPILGGGGGTLFAAGVKSSSLLFCSPSLKYSSNAELGETTFLAFLPVLGGPGAAAPMGGGGGGEAKVAGTSKSLLC